MIEDNNLEPKKILTLFTTVSLLFFVAAILSCLYFFYYKKNFNFFVEFPCDSSREQCFIRDCSGIDACPPNEMSSFKRVQIKASDFKYCTNEDCTYLCESGQIECRTVVCKEDRELGESCSAKITETLN